ncbi:hypothetical protein Tco_1556064 [Tanacetum coccineum]
MDVMSAYFGTYDHAVILNIHFVERRERYVYLWRCVYHISWADISSRGLDHEDGSSFVFLGCFGFLYCLASTCFVATLFDFFDQMCKYLFLFLDSGATDIGGGVVKFPFSASIASISLGVFVSDESFCNAHHFIASLGNFVIESFDQSRMGYPMHESRDPHEFWSPFEH